jgi:hypothetical protein
MKDVDRRARVAGTIGGLAVAALAGFWLRGHVPSPDPIAHAEPAHARDAAPVTTPPPRVPAPALAVAPTPWPAEPLRWLAAAGGSIPEQNQISIAQDLELARQVLGPGGRVLFGAGAGSPSVQVLADAPPADALVLVLADLFAPRGGRDATYREPELLIDDAATRATVIAALHTAVSEGSDPLVVLLGGHGLAGEAPRDNVISLWGGADLGVVDLADALERAERPVLVVATTCFSGGFAEIAFAGADSARGAAATPRCGLFAAPWDLEASGCDPDPDRSVHEGYGVHWLHALRGQDRTGAALPKGAIDLDGDGTITALEAHTRVRMAADTADVPTTTAERWLRHAAPTAGASIAVALPEEHAVVRQLAARLGLEGREHEAAAELERLQAAIDALDGRLQTAGEDEDEAYRAAAADVLARWPVLDDPWHPEFSATLERARPAIEIHLETSETYAAYLAARTRVDSLGAKVWDLRRRAAPYERLARAHETIELAGRLRAAGGPAFTTYEQILACERTPIDVPGT